MRTDHTHTDTSHNQRPPASNPLTLKGLTNQTKSHIESPRRAAAQSLNNTGATSPTTVTNPIMLTIKVFLSLSIISITPTCPLEIPLYNINKPNTTLSSHPLNAYLVFRENTSVTYHVFPVTPKCENLLDIKEEQDTVTVSIWKVDQSSQAEYGILIWKEQIKTLCTWEFFGTYKGSEVSRSLGYVSELPSNDTFNKAKGWIDEELQELDNVPYSLRYFCYYCRNEYPGVYSMTYGKKIRIVRYPDGEIKSPAGNWINFDGSLYHDGRRYLKVFNTDSKNTCPFKIYEVRAGIMSRAQKGNYIISLPSVNLQFSLSPARDPIKCSFSGVVYSIDITMGGYLISVENNGQNWRDRHTTMTFTSTLKTRSKRFSSLDKITRRLYNFVYSKRLRQTRQVSNWEFAHQLKSTLDYSQLRYEQQYVINQINKNFHLLQKSICDHLSSKWLQITPPDLPRKVSNYLTGNHYSIADHHNGIYRIQSTAISQRAWQLKVPLVINHGMYRVVEMISNETAWAEPVTGILFNDSISTHFSLVTQWLPGANGSAINPTTGKTVIPEASVDRVHLITQPEAYAGKALYNQTEMAADFNNNDYYKSVQSQESSEGTTLETWWMPFVIQGGISILAGAAVYIFLPAVLRFCKKLISKGEKPWKRV